MMALQMFNTENPRSIHSPLPYNDSSSVVVGALDFYYFYFTIPVSACVLGGYKVLL